MKEVQDTVSKTALPLNISVLSSTWQQFEYSIDVCHINGNMSWEYLWLLYVYIVVRLVCLSFCYSQTVFRMLVPEIFQDLMKRLQLEPLILSKCFGTTNILE